jgi:hypothetical protein
MNNKGLTELMAGMRPGKGKEVRLSLILHQRDRNQSVFQRLMEDFKLLKVMIRGTSTTTGQNSDVQNPRTN